MPNSTNPATERLERRLLRPHRAAIATAVFGLLLQAILVLPIPVLQGWLIDRLFELQQHGDAAAAVGPVILTAFAATVVCLVTRSVVAWRTACSMGRISLEVVRDLTNELHAKLQRLPLAYFDRERTGRLMARMTCDVGSLLVFLRGSSLQLVCDTILAAGIACVLTAIHPLLAAFSLAVVPLYVFNYSRHSRRLRERSARAAADTADLCALLCERLSAIRIVRTFGQEDAEIALLEERLDRQHGLSWSTLRIGARQSGAAIVIAGLGSVVALACGARFVNERELSVGQLLAFYLLLAQLYQPLVRLTHCQAIVAGTRVAIGRIAETMNEPISLVETSTDSSHGGTPGCLEFRNVSFRYYPGTGDVLADVSFALRPGGKLGILGPSGAGKSTLLALIPRLYETNRGCISLDGVDVRGMRIVELRRRIVLAPQNATLFEGTLRSNLSYGRPDASLVELERTLDLVALGELLTSAQGWDLPIGDRGATLSGGQRQRLTLGRALLTQPDVLLLDDCTSALDAATEALVLANVRRECGRRTLLHVSHRVRSLLDCDWILVLDRGRIVEQGEPRDLLEQDGRFRRLFDGQHTSESPFSAPTHE